MIDKEKLKALIQRQKDHSHTDWDYQGNVVEPFWEAVGDDRAGICKFLEDIKPKDLDHISCLFDEMFRKWPDDEMQAFLQSVEKRMTDAGYQP